MISLRRKLALRSQASAARGSELSIAALARTTQAAHSTVAVGDADVPLVDTVQEARDAAEVLPGLGDDTSLAGDDAWEAWDQSDYAVGLAERIDTDLSAAKADLDRALEEAADALESAGLARSDAAQAVADAAGAAAAATQAIQDALTAVDMAEGAAPSWGTVDPVAADGSGKPVGAVWYVRNTSGRVIRVWELTALGWVARPFDEAVIPQVAIGAGTYGDLAGDRLVAKSITAAQIKALTVTASELASNSVTAVKIAANAVTAEKILAGAVTTDKLVALAVTAEKIAAGAIVADKIAAGAITTGKLAATAIDGMLITGAKIRTAPTGERFELTAWGLQAYNAANQQTMRLAPGGDGLVMRDQAGGHMAFTTSTGIESLSTQEHNSGNFLLRPTRISISSDRFVKDQEFRVLLTSPSSNPALGGVVIESSKADLSMYTAENMTIQSRAAGSASRLHLGFQEVTAQRVKASGGEFDETHIREFNVGIRANDTGQLPKIFSGANDSLWIRTTAASPDNPAPIYLDGPVSFQGDTAWWGLTMIPSGYTAVDGAAVRIKNGVLYGRGKIVKDSGTIPSGTLTLGTFATPIAGPPAVVNFLPAWHNSASSPGIGWISANRTVNINSTGNGATGVSLNSLSGVTIFS